MYSVRLWGESQINRNEKGLDELEKVLQDNADRYMLSLIHI